MNLSQSPSPIYSWQDFLYYIFIKILSISNIDKKAISILNPIFFQQGVGIMIIIFSPEQMYSAKREKSLPGAIIDPK
jgi:hypothetical protein